MTLELPATWPLTCCGEAPKNRAQVRGDSREVFVGGLEGPAAAGTPAETFNSLNSAMRDWGDQSKRVGSIC